MQTAEGKLCDHCGKRIGPRMGYQHMSDGRDFHATPKRRCWYIVRDPNTGGVKPHLGLALASTAARMKDLKIGR